MFNSFIVCFLSSLAEPHASNLGFEDGVQPPAAFAYTFFYS